MKRQQCTRIYRDGRECMCMTAPGSLLCRCHLGPWTGVTGGDACAQFGAGVARAEEAMATMAKVAANLR